MVIRNFILLVLIFTAQTISAQLLEFKDVEKLPSTINSDAEEGMPLLTPDGQRLYFSRALYNGNIGGEYSGHDVWYSDKNGDEWKRASNLKTVNDRDNNVLIGIQTDGKKLYYLNASGKNKVFGIYFSTLLNKYWTQPEFISVPGVENKDYIGLYVSPDYDVIFFSMKATDSEGEEDIYYSVKDSFGAWTAPKSIGPTVNSTGFEISPFLSADKKKLYFSSNGHGGEGDADIFYSERLYNSWETWSTPVNLGSVVNSKKFDAYFSVYGDTLAYFASNRDSYLSDLYQVSIGTVKTILAQGQYYLSLQELDNYIGKNVMRKISFNKNETTLNASQKELLFYIANKLMLERDIRFHLVVKEEENPELTQKRLTAIQDHLRQVGIDSSRINVEQIASAKDAKKGEIEILLYK